MQKALSPVDSAKFAAARRAVEFVQPGMRLGLGSGSTAEWMLRCLADRVRDEELQVTGVPTSRRTADLAAELGIPLATLDAVKWLDLTIDGADEFDADLNLIKGGGAALLREKIIASASEKMIVIADAGKEVAHLGAFPLPVEVVPFGWQTTKGLIEETLAGMDVLGNVCTLRMTDGQPLTTDGSNLIIDLHLKRIGNPRHLALVLNQVPGVIENGLFIDAADVAVIGHANGRVVVRDITDGHQDQYRTGTDGIRNIFAGTGD
jgi:ribose 5-phosphate isomerase A